MGECAVYIACVLRVHTACWMSKVGGLRDEGLPLVFPCRYTFYDGPPFATGLPHYGHILAGTIKVGVEGGCEGVNDDVKHVGEAGVSGRGYGQVMCEDDRGGAV